jgi:Sugar phosphate isomerases/epimerases
MFRFGVDTFIWTENFTEKDLWTIARAEEMGFDAIDFAIAHPFSFPVKEVKAELGKTRLEPVLSTTLGAETNMISPNHNLRAAGVAHMKKMIDIAAYLGANIIGGVNYAGWGCLTGAPRTAQEWDWGVSAMKEVVEYAEQTGGIVICVECVNRFETHFLNIAEDAVKFCRDVGGNNIKVHLDCFHMIREEESFAGAVETCGLKYLGYIHVCESNRGIPGTALVPFREFFAAVKDIGYTGPLVIESFDPSFVELNKNCAIWRRFAETGEELAREGLANLRAIAAEVFKGGS